ncbi:MAG: hypothetical protein KBD14_01640 [Candidatus Pacebacteria bacterium]|nr:hypothetical protein [Candidatus Paceibacterota bacterium]
MEKLTLKNERSGTCKHNTMLEKFCELCFEEAKNNQLIWNKIQELIKNSRGQRENLKPETKIEIGNIKFEIKQITDKKDPNLEEVFKLLETNFKPEELSGIESFAEKIEGKQMDGSERIKYRCFYVKDNNNKIVAVRISENIPLITENKSKMDENIFYGLYIVVDEKYRSSGLARELYISALIDAMTESQKQNKSLKYLLAECTPSSENLMNSIGLEKIFLKNNNTWKEFEYYQPALDFDNITGHPTKGEFPEHIMVANLEDEINKENFYDIIASLLNQYKNSYSRKDFANDEAFITYQNYYNNLYNDISRQLEESSELKGFNIEEQKEITEQGSEIIHFNEANKR